MNLGIWNVQGIRNKQQEIMQDLKNKDISIAILSETKKKGSGSERTNDYIHFFTGVSKDQRARAGISIFIHRRYERFIRSWESYNERFIKLTIYIRGTFITFLGVYAINDDSLVQEKEDFEEEFKRIMNEIPNSHEIILGGDLNARVGRQRHNNIIGMHGEDTLNNNGERLKNLCQQYELKIMNGFFSHKNIHKYTWYQHTRGLKSIIDYLIIKQKTDLRVQDVKVHRGADCGSDHCLVVGKVYIPFKGKTQKETDAENGVKIERICYNLDSLENESTRLLYSWRLQQKLIEEHRSTKQEYEHIKTCIKEAAEEALGRKDLITNKNKPYWWDTDIEDKINRKKELYKKTLGGDEEAKAQYKIMNRDVKREVVSKKNSTWEKKCEYIDNHLGGSKNPEAWKTIKAMKTTSKNNIVLNSIPEREWTEHYKNLLTEGREKFLTEEQCVESTDTIDLTTEQVQQAIKGTKSKKAPGPGGIHPEFIKYGPPKLTEMLKKLYERCLNGDEIPEEWKQSYISPIHKKGSKSDPQNYRGIAVIPTIGRVYSRILRDLIETDIQNKQPEEQAGFRAGRSTVDNTFTLKIALEKRVQRNRETHIALIDLEKAYDSVPVTQLWKEMKNLEIKTGLIQATKKYYEENSAKIKIGNKVTTSFKTTKGLRQGCCLSPTLFKIYLDRALINWTKKCRNMGLKVGEDTLFTLFFADDQIVIAEDEEDLSYMIRKLEEEYERAGLAMNMRKCEYLIVGKEDTPDLILENGKIKGVETCKYLGVVFNKKGNSENEIKERINKGRTIIRTINSLLWQNKIRRETKKHIYNSIVQNVILYGAEIWDVTKKDKDKLMATEMDFLRRSCGRSRLERIRNEQIREEMKMDRSIKEEIERRQLVWFGHVKRMQENRWPRKVLEWIPPERRKRGRPRRSWRDDIDDAMSTRGLEEQETEDRKRWKLGTEKRQ